MIDISHVDATSDNYRRLLGELLAHEATGGVLPYPASWIAAMEFAGHWVDLDTGEIHLNDRNNARQTRVTPTVVGEATSHLLKSEGFTR